MIWAEEKHDLTYNDCIMQIADYLDIFGNMYKLREFDHCTENPTLIVRKESIYDDGCQYIHEDRATRMQILALKVLLKYISNAYGDPFISFAITNDNETDFKQLRITKLDLPNYYIYGIIDGKDCIIDIDHYGNFTSDNLDEVYIDELNRRRSYYETSFK
jgi:hypothetical protein